MTLTTEQAQAVEMMTGSTAPRVACLTGGPGTGKTYTITAILDALGKAGRTFHLCAPSGKAALRMSEATGRQATTLHRLLGLRPGAVDAAIPVMVDTVVVDESSMVDVSLMATFLSCCFDAGRVCSVLLVGDAEQLPPVGPGRPFHDMVEAESIPTVRLTQVKRQGEGSGIALAAAAIRAGEVPEFNGTDFRLVECEDPKALPGVVHRVLCDLGTGPAESQVLAPQRTTVCGVDALNALVEERRPVTGPWDAELVRGLYRVGTKVIHTRNDYDLGVFNGEIGTVRRAVSGGNKRGADHLEVDIAGETKHYRGGSIAMLRPAWALTVHKSQGSEWADVVVVAHPAHSYMLSRSLLYVAVTRARQRCVVVGTHQAVGKAVRKVRDMERNTMLAEWIRREAA